MNLKEQLDALLDATAFDSTGTKIGAVRQVYVDDASGKVTFATVATGIFSADAIVPLHGARLLDDELHVDHTRDVVRDSPRPDHTEDALTPDQEVKLLEYYGIEPPSDARPTDARGAAAGAGGAAAGAAGKGTSTSTSKDSGSKNPTSKDANPKDKGAGTAKAASKNEGADKTPAAEKSTGAESKPTAGSSPTTRETSPIAAPKATPKDDRGEMTPTPAPTPATPTPTPTPTPTTTTTTTKSTTPGGAADSPRTEKSSRSGPADPSNAAGAKARDTGDSPSRD